MPSVSIYTVVFSLFSLLTFLSVAYGEEKWTAKDHYLAGRIAFKKRAFAEAEKHFQSVLAKDRNHAYSLNYLAQIKRLRREGRSPVVLKNRLETVILPPFNLKDVSLEDGLKWLRTSVQRKTKDQWVPNLVLKAEEAHKGKTFSLQLGPIPALQVLEYICQLTDSKARYDPHAVLIEPIAPSGPSAGEEESKSSSR